LITINSWKTAARQGIHTWSRTWKTWRRCQDEQQDL